MKIKFEVQTSVNRIKCTMLPLIFMRLSDVAAEKNHIFLFSLTSDNRIKIRGNIVHFADVTSLNRIV